MPTNTPLPEATFPIDFRLLNQQGQRVLYTRLLTQSLDVELRNTSCGDVTLVKPGESEPSTPEENKTWCQDNHSFYITFRQGTLWTP